MALVSIIIPCRNAGRWLAEAVESALGQTWPEKEVIVVDDGSTDGSPSVARAYEARGLVVLTQPNAGAAAARNGGLRIARGDFVQFLDADDVLSPDKIAAQMEILLASPPGTVASSRWGRFRDKPLDTVFSDHAVFRDFAPAREFLIHQAATSDMMHPAAWLAPRTAITAAGPWNETLSLNDDGEYFCRVLLGASTIRFSPRGSVHYRSGLPGSVSRDRSRSALVSLHRSIALYADHLTAADGSPRVRSALANYWRRAQFELYPEAPDLSADAGRRSRERGRASNALPFGPRLRVVAVLFGWRIARRLQRKRQR